MRIYPHLLWLTVLVATLPRTSLAAEAAERLISVTGEATVSAAPDMATITTGVVTSDSTAHAALKQNNQAMQAIMQVLEHEGIAQKDMQTSSFNVSPIRKRNRQGQTQPEITGYQVQNRLEVHLRNLADLGEVLDSLVEAGSNEISGIRFGVGDPTGILDQARSRAIRDARRRADVYAQAAGVRVGKVQEIREQPVGIPQPRQLSFAMAEAARVPVATGEQDFRVTVHVTFELIDGSGN